MTAALKHETWEADDLDAPDDMPDMPEPGEDGVTPPQFIPDDHLANDALRHLRHWYAERERIQAQAARERLRIDERERRMLEQIERRIAWHEGGLRAFLGQLGVRAWKGIQGSVGLRKGRERVEVEDEAAFLRWADMLDEETHDLVVHTTVAPSKSGIARWIKGLGAGELPAGVIMLSGPDTLSVKVED